MSHSIHCQLNILNLKNLNSLHHLLQDQLFIRCYISIPSNKRFRIETQQLPFHASIDIKSNNSRSSVEDLLKNHNIIFELRLRNRKSVFKFASKSKLLGKAEISWMDVLHANGTSVEKCISFIMFHRLSIDVKPPSLTMKMEANVTGETTKMMNGGHECDCETCQWIGCEEDVFLAATAALDAAVFS